MLALRVRQGKQLAEGVDVVLPPVVRDDEVAQVLDVALPMLETHVRPAAVALDLAAYLAGQPVDHRGGVLVGKAVVEMIARTGEEPVDEIVAPDERVQEL